MAKDFNLKPLDDRIVVQPSEGEQTTVSGLVIPDTAKEKPQEGDVMAVGPGRFEDGDRVPHGRQRRRQGHLLQVRRHRGQGRGRGVPDPLRARRARHPRLTNIHLRSGLDALRGGPRSVDDRSKEAAMAAKQLKFSEDARRALEAGVNKLADAVAHHARPEGPQRRPRQEVGRAHHHQRRCDDRQGGRARGPVREHGRPARQGGRHQDERRRR